MSLTSITGESREEAFKSFITSLKHNREYAPAYTSLGVYYSEHASPPDPTRASKCFQKAFELDAREAEAARRLAEGFADEREWDLVEVVARRTIDGEGGMGAGVEEGDSATSGKYLPTNAWAWKALGVVELVRDRTVKHMFNLMFWMTDKEELFRIHQGLSSRAPGGG
jgi:superkiller protein 3